MNIETGIMKENENQIGKTRSPSLEPHEIRKTENRDSWLGRIHVRSRSVILSRWSGLGFRAFNNQRLAVSTMSNEKVNGIRARRKAVTRSSYWERMNVNHVSCCPSFDQGSPEGVSHFDLWNNGKTHQGSSPFHKIPATVMCKQTKNIVITLHLRTRCNIPSLLLGAMEES